jgi:CubicO group peptidase (beta-lactamase class C family)
VEPLQRDLDAVARDSGFSGVVRVDGFEAAYGSGITAETQFGIASGTKSVTAVTIASLIDDGVLSLATTARSLLHDDLPLIRDDVTVEHLLSHTSGIGDYYDEELEKDFEDFMLPVPVEELQTTEDYLKVLDGHATKFAPGERFSYCNSGYVVLALIAERAANTSFYDLVQERVCARAGMDHTAFLRSDALPGSAAIGRLADGRTNAAHLPVRGSGDGGIYSTAADVFAFWRAFLDGKLVSEEWVRELTRRRTEKYGMGFWLDEQSDMVIVTGADAGVSFHSAHSPSRAMTYAVLSNTSEGAWPLARHLRDVFRT